MGSWSALLLAYLLGGITFIPLLVLAVLSHAHFSFPHRRDVGLSRNASGSGPAVANATYDDDDKDGIVQPGDDTTALDEAKRNGLGKLPSSTNVTTTTAAAAAARPREHLDVASGYFAVCREYTPMGINAKPIERSTPVGSTTVAAPSPSVYQTMYRSIFDRKAAPAGPVDNGGMSQRPKKAGNVFYVVLR